jgi:LPS sulfotransferase NodH
VGPAARPAASYVRAIWDQATTPNGVLGSKLLWNDFDWLWSSTHAPAGTETTESLRIWRLFPRQKPD